MEGRARNGRRDSLPGLGQRRPDQPRRRQGDGSGAGVLRGPERRPRPRRARAARGGGDRRPRRRLLSRPRPEAPAHPPARRARADDGRLRTHHAARLHLPDPDRGRGHRARDRRRRDAGLRVRPPLHGRGPLPPPPERGGDRAGPSHLGDRARPGSHPAPPAYGGHPPRACVLARGGLRAAHRARGRAPRRAGGRGGARRRGAARGARPEGLRDLQVPPPGDGRQMGGGAARGGDRGATESRHGQVISEPALVAQEERFARAFAAGDLSLARALYDPHVVYLSPTVRLFGWPARIEGVERSVEFIALTIRHLEAIAYRAVEWAIVPAGQAAFVRIQFDFTRAGRRLRSDYVVVYRYRDGLIAQQELYYDPSSQPKELDGPP